MNGPHSEHHSSPMTPTVRRIATLAAVVALLTAVVTPKAAVAPVTRVSFSNRLLLNRAVLNGLTTIEVMLLVSPDRVETTMAKAVEMGGDVRYSAGPVGYFRVAVPIEHFKALVTAPEVQAFQVSSLAQGTWYRDAVPQSNAEMFRGYERLVPRAAEPAEASDLPVMPESVAHQPAYTADEDSGVGQWLDAHPVFDGRGVTIALLESGGVDFGHPAIGTAKTLDGRDVSKIRGIFNPASPALDDNSRVVLSTRLTTSHAWVKAEGRTYSVPHPGTYRLGTYTLPAAINAIHEFPIIEDERTGEIFVDTDGDADFRDERSMTDVNDAIDVQELSLTYPRASRLKFVMARGHRPHTVHIYPGTNSHTTMLLSVAAASRQSGSLAYGVAPNARVLLVPVFITHSGTLLSGYVEAFIDAIKRPDVDILCDAVSESMAPDTGADFAGLVFSRMAATYNKPIFHAAGNFLQFLNSVSAFGDAFSVGGSISPAAFAALFGGGALPGPAIHPIGAAGPAVDGALKPDFVAPVHVIAADLSVQDTPVPLPRNAPVWQLPHGYQISCCTSSSTPYAAGIGALLISAAKQAHVPYSVRALGRALRAGATFLPDWHAYEQGSGVLDVNAAWQELRRAPEIPRIKTTSSVVHALAPYAAHGNEGVGLFEREGWHAGMSGRRAFHFTRQTGPLEPQTYRVSWTGNDGTFRSATSVTLPLNTSVEFAVDVVVRTPGGHSAILDLHDPATDAIILRRQATVVASEEFDHRTHRLDLSGTLPLMRTRTHYLHVPPMTDALDIEVTVLRGSLSAGLLPGHSLYPAYYFRVHPHASPTYGPGTHHVMIPHPSAGTWAVSLRNDSAWLELDPTLVSTGEAEYRIAARLLGSRVDVAENDSGGLTVSIENTRSTIERPIIEVSRGRLETVQAEFLTSGLPNVFDINIPEGTATLALWARSPEAPAPALELHLYDCTTGECFSHDFTLPAAHEAAMTLRKPRPGRWVAAVSAAPYLGSPGSFEFEWMITRDAATIAGDGGGPRRPGERWTTSLAQPRSPASAEADNALLVEVVDGAAEERVRKYPWQEAPNSVLKPPSRISAQPVSAGSAIWRLP